MNLLETYVHELREIRASGSAVRETSYYPALANLLNRVGAILRPRVRCVINIKNQGAGIPDGGLFTPDQYASGDEPVTGQIPARGVIEAKGTNEDVREVARSEQVLRYLRRYGQVLVTNYRDFLLVGLDPDGGPAEREEYRLAGSEAEFWGAEPGMLAEARGASFSEYLKRAMLYAAPLAEPRDLAFFLASYAREARARVEEGDLPTLEGVRGALEEALGLRFEGERGEPSSVRRWCRHCSTGCSRRGYCGASSIRPRVPRGSTGEWPPGRCGCP